MNAKIERKYNKDFYAWLMHNAALLRQGRFSEVDNEHLAEELESMGRSDKRELINRLAILLAHLLKWQFQPERRGNSWQYTIAEQRFELIDLLKESPSLKPELSRALAHAYQKAVLLAVKETGINKTTLPTHCPFSLAQSLDENFLPE